MSEGRPREDRGTRGPGSEDDGRQNEAVSWACFEKTGPVQPSNIKRTLSS